MEKSVSESTLSLKPHENGTANTFSKRKSILFDTDRPLFPTSNGLDVLFGTDEWSNLRHERFKLESERNAFEEEKRNWSKLQNSLMNEIHTFVKTSKAMVEANVKQLLDENSSIQAVSEQVIESVLFSRIYGNIIELFKTRNKQEDLLIHQKIKTFNTLTLKNLGVPPELWLSTENSAASSAESYQEAIIQLRKISNFDTPTEKLMCLSSVSKSIFQSVDKYYKSLSDPSEEQIVIGGDNFLPIFTFVVLQANIKNPFSEKSFIEVFINDKATFGEYGYIFASFQASLEIILNLEWKQFSSETETEKT